MLMSYEWPEHLIVAEVKFAGKTVQILAEYVELHEVIEFYMDKSPEYMPIIVFAMSVDEDLFSLYEERALITGAKIFRGD
jgi:hypothetical protein